MWQVLRNSWALMLGMLLLMIGNGMQATLMGVRGGIEGFSTLAMSLITAAYFVGFLAGSRLTPHMIRRVGHVRVFAALGSLVSAALILFPVFTDPAAWTALRVILGFCLSGVYVAAESWLNNAVTNDRRGTALSAYMGMQMLGLVSAQGLMNVADAGGFGLFILPSVLVSLSFAPILLSVQRAPAHEATRPMTLRRLYGASPLGIVGMFLLGGVFSAQFGMASVYGSEAGLSVREVSAFVAAIFTGSLMMQLPVGWLSDRMDRRRLIAALAVTGAGSTALGVVSGDGTAVLLVLAFAMGGIATPLYALLISYTNDYLDREDMAAASGGLVFVYGLGAIGGPLLTGAAMDRIGPSGFWVFVAVTFAAVALYSLWRMTRRAPVPAEETGSYVAVGPVATGYAAEWAQEVAAEAETTGGEASQT